ncbi:MAG: hypothetical protein ACOX6L_02560 [Syntrophomonadaceae bacterium]
MLIITFPTMMINSDNSTLLKGEERIDPEAVLFLRKVEKDA